jgi:hypothetical protein
MRSKLLIVALGCAAVALGCLLLRREPPTALVPGSKADTVPASTAANESIAAPDDPIAGTIAAQPETTRSAVSTARAPAVRLVSTKIHGRVVDRTGSAVAGAYVECVNDAGSGPVMHSALRRPGGNTLVCATSADDGSYELANPPPQRVRVSAKTAESQFCWTEAFDIVPGGDVALPDIVLVPIDRSDVIEVLVLDSNGSPVPQAELGWRVECVDALYDWFVFRTDDRGVGHKIVEQRCPYDLIARAPDDTCHVAIADAVMPGGPRVEMRFFATTTIALTVLDNDRAPIDHYLARVADPTRKLQEDPFAENLFAHIEQVEARCWPFFATDEVRAGGASTLCAPLTRCSVEVDAPGYAHATAGPFEPDAIPASLELRLNHLPGASGIVVAGGELIAGAKVALHQAVPRSDNVFFADMPARSETESIASATTDAHGAFDIGFTHEGPIYVRAEAKGIGVAELGPFDVVRGAALIDLRLDVGKSGSIEGRVLASEGEPVADLGVCASRGDGFVKFVTSGADGTFRFNGLTPGSWLVRNVDTSKQNQGNSHRDYSGDPKDGKSARDLPWSCKVSDGGVTHFDLDLRARVVLHGRVEATSTSIGGWFASLGGDALWNGGGGNPLDGNGAFTVRGEEPGNYELDLGMKLSLGWGLISVPVRLTAGENTWRAKLEFGAIDVSCPSRGTVKLEADLGDGKRATAYPILDERGESRLAAVPAGTWTAKVYDRTTNKWSVGQPAVLPVGGNITLTTP